MGTYGRNVSFRVLPFSEQRQGRFSTPTTGAPIPMGAPVVADLTAGIDALGLQVVKLAPSGSAPIGPLSGIALFEYAPAAFAGFDPLLTTYSDLGTIPLGKALQVIKGGTVKLVLANTVAESFLGNRTYPGRTMVNGLGATPTVIVGDYLVPGAGDDVAGYWTSQASATGAWLQITGIDVARAQVEAQMVF